MAEYIMDELRLTGMPGETAGDVWKMPRTKVDSTLTQTGQAAEAKKTGEEIDALNEGLTQKANSDGSYENMKVGLAENLDPTVFIEDTAAYTFRTSGGNNDIGDFEKLSEIVGGSLVWNQLIENGDFATETKWVVSSCSYSVSNNVATVVVNQGQSSIYFSQPIEMVTGHKYFIGEMIKGNGEYANVGVSQGAYFIKQLTTTQNWQKVEAVFESNGSVNINAARSVGDRQAGDTVYVKNVVLIDLTVLFDSAEIADYIYALETANAGAGVAWIRKYFAKDYYAYCAPHFEHTQVDAHETVGFNQFDKSNANSLTAGIISNAITYGTGRCTVYIPCLPNTAYCASRKAVETNERFGIGYTKELPAAGVDVYGYQSANNSQTVGTTMTVTTTTSADAKYIVVWAYWDSKTEALDTLCINLHWDGSRDGEYEAYDKRSYPLDSSVVLKGVPYINDSGELCFSGDAYESNGNVSRKIVQKTFDGTENYWSSYSPNSNLNQFYTTGTACKSITSSNGVTTICDSFPSIRISQREAKGFGTCYADADGICFNIDPEVCATVADWKAFLQEHPVTVLYKTYDVTEEEADPFMETQWVNDFGTERFVPAESLTRDVEIPVGHVTKYPPDLKAKLEMVPNSPPSNGLWLVQHENGENTYVQYIGELPADPDEDGSYYLKATRSSGTTTLSWEAQE